MATSDFDIGALYLALDHERCSRGMTWAAVALEINRFTIGARPIAASTITGLKNRALVEGDGVLQMLLWLRRTPESFVEAFEGADDVRFHLPTLGAGQILRWDAKALYAALDVERRVRSLEWKEVAVQVGGTTANAILNLAKGGRTSFPGVMRIVRWLGRPATTFTRVTSR